MFHDYLADRVLCSALIVGVVWAAASDVATFKIPNAACLLLLLLYPLHVFASPIATGWPAAIAIAGALFGLGVSLFSRGMVGGGDVKLLSAVSLWAGPHEILPVIFVIACAGGILAVLSGGLFFLRRGRSGLTEVGGEATAVLRMPVPYGVAIACGGFYDAILLLHS